jgi:hypothetical protein
MCLVVYHVTYNAHRDIRNWTHTLTLLFAMCHMTSNHGLNLILWKYESSASYVINGLGKKTLSDLIFWKVFTIAVNVSLNIFFPTNSPTKCLYRRTRLLWEWRHCHIVNFMYLSINILEYKDCWFGKFQSLKAKGLFSIRFFCFVLTFNYKTATFEIYFRYKTINLWRHEQVKTKSSFVIKSENGKWE